MIDREKSERENVDRERDKEKVSKRQIEKHCVYISVGERERVLYFFI